MRDTLDHLATSQGRASAPARRPATCRARVLGDALRLRQVLLNLVGNAIKFSSVGGDARPGRTCARRCVELERDSDAPSEFVVDDNGIGMDEATLARLFTPFMQADDSTTRRFGGTGLGLSISHRLADLMGGTIEVDQPAGRRVVLHRAHGLRSESTPSRPAAPPTEPAAEFVDSGVGGAPAATTTMPMPLSALGASEAGRLILVAEDNEINQEVIRQQLALMGFTAEIVANGLRGARALAQRRLCDAADRPAHAGAGRLRAGGGDPQPKCRPARACRSSP